MVLPEEFAHFFVGIDCNDWRHDAIDRDRQVEDGRHNDDPLKVSSENLGNNFRLTEERVTEDKSTSRLVCYIRRRSHS